jgi:hypothetical protein
MVMIMDAIERERLLREHLETREAHARRIEQHEREIVERAFTRPLPDAVEQWRKEGERWNEKLAAGKAKQRAAEIAHTKAMHAPHDLVALARATETAVNAVASEMSRLDTDNRRMRDLIREAHEHFIEWCNLVEADQRERRAQPRMIDSFVASPASMKLQ